MESLASVRPFFTPLRHKDVRTELQNSQTAFSTFIITISLHYLLTDASIDKYDIV